MLLTASDWGKAQQARKQLFQAGIPSEIRQEAGAQWPFAAPSDPELWLCHDGDIFKAMKVLSSGSATQLTLAFAAS